MSGLLRIAGLTLRSAKASSVRFLLLSIIAAVSMTVFLIIGELSRQSSRDLDQAIAADAGRRGTYAVDFISTMGFNAQEMARKVGLTLAPFSPRRLLMVVTTPDVARDCPPSEALGTGPVLVLFGVDGRAPRPLAGGALPPSLHVCIGGQAVPSPAVRAPSPTELASLLGVPLSATVPEGLPGGPLILDPEFDRVLLLGAGEPASYRFVVVTGHLQDRTSDIQQALEGAFGERIRRYGANASDVFSVVRQDTGDAEIKRAAEGVRVMYGVIAWGILGLGALGLLAAEIISVRDRSWFFGLSRAVGGTGGHIAALVIGDVVAVLVSGTLLACVIVLAVQPVARSFAQNAFQLTGVAFLRLAVIPRLVIGEFLVLLVSGAWPALKAVRQDPLDVLEPRSTG